MPQVVTGLTLLLICVLAFAVRLFSVIKYESVIHEFDPYFNYRVTRFLTEVRRGWPVSGLGLELGLGWQYKVQTDHKHGLLADLPARPTISTACCLVYQQVGYALRQGPTSA